MFSNCYICNNFLMITKYSPCDFLSPPEQMILSVLVFILFFFRVRVLPSQGMGAIRRDAPRVWSWRIQWRSCLQPYRFGLVGTAPGRQPGVLQATVGRGRLLHPQRPHQPVRRAALHRVLPRQRGTTIFRHKLWVRKFGPNNTNFGSRAGYISRSLIIRCGWGLLSIKTKFQNLTLKNIIGREKFYPWLVVRVAIWQLMDNCQDWPNFAPPHPTPPISFARHRDTHTVFPSPSWRVKNSASKLCQ